MTLRKIIEKLRKEGHQVEYIEQKPVKSKRSGKRSKTGQIRITRIDNKTYVKTLSVGNKRAREMAGEKLSAKQEQQIKQAREKIQTKPRVSDLPEDIERDLRRIQAKIRRSEKRKAKAEGKDEIEKSKSTLRLKKKTIRKKLKEEGYTETKRALQAIERYWEGYANESSIQALFEILNSIRNALTNNKDVENLTKCISILNEIKDRLSEYALEDLLSATYDFQKGALKSADLVRIFENKRNQKGQIKGQKHNI